MCCKDCESFELNASQDPCLSCSEVHNKLTNNFAAKKKGFPDWIFMGCPVFLKLKNGFEYGFYINNEHVSTTSGEIYGGVKTRLPTIEESPRNVLLCHDGSKKCPEGAEDLKIAIIEGDGVFSSCDGEGATVRKGGKWSWAAVTYFMIVDLPW